MIEIWCLRQTCVSSTKDSEVTLESKERKNTQKKVQNRRHPLPFELFFRVRMIRCTKQKMLIFRKYIWKEETSFSFLISIRKENPYK